jgi:hypothetical protein
MDKDRPGVWTGIRAVEKERAGGGERAHRATGSATRARRSLSGEGAAVMESDVRMPDETQDSTGPPGGSRRPAVGSPNGLIGGSNRRRGGLNRRVEESDPTIGESDPRVEELDPPIGELDPRVEESNRRVRDAECRVGASNGSFTSYRMAARIAPHRSRATGPAASSR